jgi:hypothetical protein
MNAVSYTFDPIDVKAETSKTGLMVLFMVIALLILSRKKRNAKTN